MWAILFIGIMGLILLGIFFIIPLLMLIASVVVIWFIVDVLRTP